MENEQLYNVLSNDRISARQIDELIGIARGLCADGVLNQAEVEYLQKWLAANEAVVSQPLVARLLLRVNDILSDGIVDRDEQRELFETLHCLVNNDFELGETLKSSTLPLCVPPPQIVFAGRRYTFTGTFMFGQRRDCERAVRDRGAESGSLTQKTDFLVIGAYATDSWKHSSFGTKILNACELRDRGFPLSIVSEEHWFNAL